MTEHQVVILKGEQPARPSSRRPGWAGLPRDASKRSHSFRGVQNSHSNRMAPSSDQERQQHREQHVGWHCDTSARLKARAMPAAPVGVAGGQDDRFRDGVQSWRGRRTDMPAMIAEAAHSLFKTRCA